MENIDDKWRDRIRVQIEQVGARQPAIEANGRRDGARVL